MGYFEALLCKQKRSHTSHWQWNSVIVYNWYCLVGTQNWYKLYQQKYFPLVEVKPPRRVRFCVTAKPA